MPVCHMLCQSMAKVAWTFSQFVNKISACQQAPCVTREVKNLTLLGSLCSPYLTFFFTPVGGLFTEGARSPRLSWSCQSSVYVRYGSPLFFWPLSFSWENIWNICRSISLVESTEFYFKRRFRESTSGVIDEIYKFSMMRSLIAKFSVMCDWYPPLLFATLFQMETNFDFTQC